MTDSKTFDVIIIGGSYAGLSAGLALGRSLRNVLIIDSGRPCNIQTPHSHNFLTQDGRTPAKISTLAREQVEKYETVKFYSGYASNGVRTQNGFEITTKTNDKFIAKKLIFATGVRDNMPDIKGFAECWGISVIHCPYCHGFEYSNMKTGILANGDMAFELGKLINNWSKHLIVFTNGKSTLTVEQSKQLKEHEIAVIEEEIDYFQHTNGKLESIVFKDKSVQNIKAIYARPQFDQQCEIPSKLGCELTAQNFLKVDAFQRTTEPGVFACGDNSSMMRAVSHAVAMGGIAGGVVNREIIEESF